MKNELRVTQPSLPDLSTFVADLEQIWQTRQLSNGGPYHQRLEMALAEYLDVPFVSLFNNGTIALIIALKALDLRGDVITTPYSFVATAHAIAWAGLRPIFVDIDPRSGNLDPVGVESAITAETTAILPVHCYGMPCDVAGMDEVARRNNLKVVYDAAHAFGVSLRGRSLLQFGDLSVLSFHATKVFNTLEGGAIVCHDAATKARIDSLKNFGFRDELTVDEIGLNGKMNELQAALGLLQLKEVDGAIARRAGLDDLYRKGLSEIDGITPLPLPAEVRMNHGYFPVTLDSAYPLSRDALYERMTNAGILARRYFFPLICDFAAYRAKTGIHVPALPNATRLANSVLCLPMHAEMSMADVDRVLEILR